MRYVVAAYVLVLASLAVYGVQRALEIQRLRRALGEAGSPDRH